MSFEKRDLSAHGMKLSEVGISTNDVGLIEEGFAILKNWAGQL